MLADLRGRVRRARSTKHESKGRWRLWPCLLVALLVPAALASVARAGTTTVSNPNPIAIPGTGTQGVANPYPSIIRLSGFSGQISDLEVRFENLTHTFPDDIDALLVGPGGQRVLLMSDTGGSADVNVDLRFDDQAANSLPDSTQILSGTYRPTNIGAGDTFPSPALGPPFSDNLAVFNGTTSVNGDWLLYVFDDAGADVGSMAGGWALEITTPVTGQGQAQTGAGQQTFNPGACSNAQRGTGGNDVLNGTRFGDRLSGRGGNDILRGRRGRDCLSGGSGRDRLSGGSGNDRLSGGSGRDRLSGDSGNDRLSGNSGNDRLSGGSGRDRLSGGSGKDRLKGGSGRNRYSGGSGRDSINSKNGRKETVRCGSGRDKVRADGFDRLIGCEVVL
jgi:Ca2+-binding RTX toxin-like protein